MPWYCCQIGAREHYTIPQALYQSGHLSQLMTDAWVPPHSMLMKLPFSIAKGLKERFCLGLSEASINAYNYSLLQFEIWQKLQKCSKWDLTIARNQWFQNQVLKDLDKLALQTSQPVILFSYSYAALELFKFAKQRGWYTVLGQIDPGPLEQAIVIQEYERYPQYRANWQPAPPEYWQNWREECALADRIVVNSQWSRQLLQQAGIATHKIEIVPLIYTPPIAAKHWVRTYPVSFSQERPLRVLFLGQVILRKGMAAVLEAVKLLKGHPIEFWIVGSQQIRISPALHTHPQIRWVGQISRSQTAHYYQNTDIFLFPTLSDGFGLTQLEAQAWRLPIIASRCCGEVVIDGCNGLMLSEVTGEAIAQSLKFCLDHPDKLQQFSQYSSTIPDFDLPQLANQLQNILFH